jgi:hypothetical protein
MVPRYYDADVNALILLRTPVVSHAQSHHGLVVVSGKQLPASTQSNIRSQSAPRSLGWGLPGSF